MGARRARGTGSVFFSKARGVWVGRRKVGGRGIERSHKNQAEMLRLLAAALPPADGVTVAEWGARWLADLSCRPRTLDIRRNAVASHIAPVLGKLRLRDLTPHHVEQAAKRWADALGSVNTVRLNLAVLHTCLQSAVRAGLRADNPVKLAGKPRSQKKKIDPFAPGELAHIIDAATARPAWRVLALLAAAGCRVGEAIALDVKDYDPATGVVHITRTLSQRREMGPPKSAAGVRTIRVPADALPAVRAAAGKRKSGPLFATGRGGRLNYPNVRLAWLRLLASLGLPARNLHQLRHSAATVMISRGTPLGDVARYLGDTVETVVRTYLHATGADAADAMDAALAAARGKR